MKKFGFLRLSCLILAGLNVFGTLTAQSGPKTFCNPLDLPYRFQLDQSVREAADPVLVLYKGKYVLFASKSGGYWTSPDMLNWQLVEPEGLPLENYAPAIMVYKDRLYYLSANAIYTTDAPESGKWTTVTTFNRGFDDPALFVDDDGRIYLYHGCYENKPLKVVELNANTFQPIGDDIEVFKTDIENRGWEVAGDLNLGKKPGDTSVNNLLPWDEGSWMNKIGGKYYLQYAAPGTQFKSYADGVLISDSPTGPFVYESYSPFSYKPAGFVTGVGHSSTFSDADQNYWHVTSVTLSQRQMFERRLALFPAGVLPDGQLVANTYLGDYPQFAPGVIKKPLTNNLTGWMLLSYNKPAKASSILTDPKTNFQPALAFDEEMSTWWSAASNKKGEWLEVDLQKKCRINAIQVNFADQGATARGRLRNDGYGYSIETSVDGKKWTLVADRRDSLKDEPHHYIELDKPQMARFVRITNAHSPAESLFSIYDLRIFGMAPGKVPDTVDKLNVQRVTNDGRKAHLTWEAVPGADFYIVRYGIAPDKLYSNYQVYKASNLEINSLNAGVKYYFTVDAINACGLNPGKKIIELAK